MLPIDALVVPFVECPGSKHGVWADAKAKQPEMLLIGVAGIHAAFLQLYEMVCIDAK